MGLKQVYLIAYNLASAAAWAYTLYVAVSAYAAGKTPAQLWADVEWPLKYAQTPAALEIVHSATGIVRSPLFTTLMQVASRLLLVWVYTDRSEASQAHWSLYLMVASWAAVEVPRYLFYAACQVMESHKTPMPLFMMRYSLFMVLYPSGITGEIFQILTALPHWQAAAPAVFKLSKFILCTYVPLGPFMIFHMFGQRARSISSRKRASMPPRPVEGALFPITNDKTGERSTSKTNQDLWVAAAKAGDDDVAESARRQRGWRFGYHKHVIRHVKMVLQSKDAALEVARAGLDAAHRTFTFKRGEVEMPIAEAMRKYKDSFPHTGVIEGEGARARMYSVPYNKGKLTGEALTAQIDKWVEAGVIEPSAGAALKAVAGTPKWTDLSDQYFVLLGATSAMGPLLMLLEHGANVIAIDLDRDFIWRKLITTTRASAGRLIFPMKKAQADCADDEDLFKNSGSNLLSQTPEIRTWLCSVEPKQTLRIGGYAYLDGALHTQLAIAMDAIMKDVCAKRKDTSLAFLCTPTDVHCIPNEALEAARDNLRAAPWWQKLAAALGMMKRNVQPTVKSSDGDELAYVDGLVPQQGPNYALAKRIQHWRAVVARSEGHWVSSNVAPSTATASVVSNKLFALSYAGWRFFAAMEVFQQETSNAVMGGMLIHDIRNAKGVANPAFKLRNPMELFAHNGLHGGVWRSAYTVSTMGSIAAVAYVCYAYSPVVIGVLALMGAGARYVAQD